MKTVLSIIVAAFVLVGATQSSQAQGGFLIGVETGQVLGANAMYQINDMIQVGSGLGLQISEGSNVFYLSPQARFLFDLGLAQTHFMMDAQLRLLFGDQSQTALVIRAGLQHWINKRVALYGGFGVLDVGFDPSFTNFGFLSPFVGAQFAL
jgi:hypothetical protein